MLAQVILSLGCFAAATPFWYALWLAPNYATAGKSRLARHRLLIRWLSATGIGILLAAVLIGIGRAMP